jgi:hypothetical protein
MVPDEGSARDSTKNLTGYAAHNGLISFPPFLVLNDHAGKDT